MGDIVKILIVVAICCALFVISLIVIRSAGKKNKYDGSASKDANESKEESEEPQIVIIEPETESKAMEDDNIDGALPESEEDDDIDKALPESEDDDEFISSPKNGKVKAMSEFDSSLIKYLESNGYDIENYMISPASFRAVLCLAAAGADSDTKTELLRAAGFKDEKEMNIWYKTLINLPDISNEALSFRLLNSVWHNKKLKGNFSENYKKYIKSFYGAEAKDVSADKITDEVNSWVNEGTEGLIPQISNDLSDTDLALINTLYLKTTWIKHFSEYLTEEGDFKAFDECNIKKVFMQQTDYYDFYEDDSVKLVVLPMNGKIQVVFAIGDISGLQDKLSNTSSERVHVKIPKFDTETSFDKGELVGFLKKRGVHSAFSSAADFTAMSSDAGFHISDVIQKTKITTDENGIEAAAATSIELLGSALPGMEDEPKEFIADEPFKYVILAGGKNKEILFYGQIVE